MPHNLTFLLTEHGREIIAVQASLWGTSLFINFEVATWDETLISGLHFIANSVLQLPFFLMSLMRYITPTLDQMWGHFASSELP